MDNKPSYYIKQLLAAKSSNDKKAIIREAALAGCIELFLGFQMGFDKTITFGVKKIPLIKGNFTDDELSEDIGEFNWDEFLKLSVKLLQRTMTEEQILIELRQVAEVVCINDWKYFYRNILTKQMKCGVSANLINSVLTEVGGNALKYIIPIWRVQRISKSHKKLTGQKTLEPKLKGRRLITVIDIHKKIAMMYTTSGAVCEDFQHIINHLVSLIPILPDSIVLDGQMINSQEYVLFDMLFYSDFKKGGGDMGLMDRHDGLMELIPYLQSVSDNDIQVLPKKKCDFDNESSMEELHVFYKDIVDQGYEWVVIKDMNGLYECKRSDVWLKWHPAK